MLKHSFDDAAKFLHLLDADAHEFCFQTFSDSKASKDPMLAQCWHASLSDAWPRLVELNNRGAGCFVTVNRTDGRGRKVENVVGVRAVWHEDDGDGFNPLPGDGTLLPHIVIETSPGKRHRYWLTNGMSAAEHAQAIEAMIARGSDPNAKGLNRVLRLPGTFHMKGAPTRVKFSSDISVGGLFPNYNAADLLSTYPAPAVPPKPEATASPALADYDRKEVVRALMSIPSTDDRDTWLRVGMSLQDCGEDGFSLWCLWSQSSEKYDDDDQRRVWESFANDKAKRVSLASLFRMAHAHGYRAPGMSEVEMLDGFTAIEPPADKLSSSDLLEFPNDISLDAIVALRRSAIVGGLLFPAQYAIIYGESTGGKSFVGLDMGFHVALGREWKGFPVNCVPVLYIALEGEGDFSLRTFAAAQKFGAPGKFFARLKIPIKLTKDNRGAEGMAIVLRACEALKAATGQAVGLVIVDTMGRALAGDDENSTQDMACFIERVKHLQETIGACVVMIHHTNKAGTMRGNALNIGSADTIMRVDRLRDPETGKHLEFDMPRNVWIEKNKAGPDGYLAFSFKLAPHEIIHDGEVMSTRVVEQCEEYVPQKKAPQPNQAPIGKKVVGWLDA